MILFRHRTFKNLNGDKDKNRNSCIVHMPYVLTWQQPSWYWMDGQSLFFPLRCVEGEKVAEDRRGLRGACDPTDYKRDAERWWACWLLWCHSADITVCWRHKMLLIIHGPVTACLGSSWSHVGLHCTEALSLAGTKKNWFSSYKLDNIITFFFVHTECTDTNASSYTSVALCLLQ